MKGKIKLIKPFQRKKAIGTKGKTIIEDGTQTRSELSDKISKDLKKRGMSFVGSTIIYSYLCAVGIINAHDKNCDFKRR